MSKTYDELVGLSEKPYHGIKALRLDIEVAEVFNKIPRDHACVSFRATHKGTTYTNYDVGECYSRAFWYDFDECGFTEDELRVIDLMFHVAVDNDMDEIIGHAPHKGGNLCVN